MNSVQVQSLRNLTQDQLFDSSFLCREFGKEASGRLVEYVNVLRDAHIDLGEIWHMCCKSMLADGTTRAIQIAESQQRLAFYTGQVSNKPALVS